MFKKKKVFLRPFLGNPKVVLNSPWAGHVKYKTASLLQNMLPGINQMQNDRWKYWTCAAYFVNFVVDGILQSCSRVAALDVKQLLRFNEEGQLTL